MSEEEVNEVSDFPIILLLFPATMYFYHTLAFFPMFLITKYNTLFPAFPDYNMLSTFLCSVYFYVCTLLSIFLPYSTNQFLVSTTITEFQPCFFYFDLSIHQLWWCSLFHLLWCTLLRFQITFSTMYLFVLYSFMISFVSLPIHYNNNMICFYYGTVLLSISMQWYFSSVWGKEKRSSNYYPWQYGS